VTENEIGWFEDFLGVGYHVYDIRPSVYLIFEGGKRKIANIWNNVIKYWPDDEIKIRFFEDDSSYDFILYGRSRILTKTWVFSKSLKISEHYKKFMDEYTDSMTLQLALYFPKEKTYELEIFKFKKKVTDVKFLKTKDNDDDNDFIISQARKKLQNASEKK
jgi:hypothetical protein